jgi:hypothetical protein
MTVPFLDLDAAYRELEQPIDAAVKRVLSSGRFILGPELEDFERCFADYVGAKHDLAVGAVVAHLPVASEPRPARGAHADGAAGADAAHGRGLPSARARRPA